MITFTQLYTESATACSLPLTDPYIPVLKRNINNALKLIKSDARRAYTRKETVADLVANQQYYQFPADSIRGSRIRINNGSLIFPIVSIESELKWDSINVIPNFAVFYPQKYFIRGANEVGVWPIPAANLPGALILAYEARMADMYLDDTVGLDITATNGNQTITCATHSFTANMVGMKFSFTDGSDGNWYNILAYTNDETLILDNYYQGPTNTSTGTIIGSCPDIPEAYQLALEFFANAMYYSNQRKDPAMASFYQEQYELMHDGYIGAYASKETSQIIQPQDGLVPYNPLLVPPMGLTG